jgi:aminomethyltransferase
VPDASLPAQPQLLHTPLYDLHERLGARLVPFAGYVMPLQYRGIMDEHRHTRASASLFDVSHMGQAILRGTDVAAFLESLCPGEIAALKLHAMRYSVLLNADGGIVDDVMITRRDDDFLLVVNAARKDVDFALIRSRLPSGIKFQPLPDHALLALQGPDAETVLATLTPAATQLSFMRGMFATVAGAPAYITRSGYTGEDGFELSVAAPDAVRVAEALLAHPAVAPAGLGARDTLRLEAGLCLYGHDLDETTTPVEADLGFVIGKRRREQGGFPGAARIQRELIEGPARLRVAFLPEGRAPVREGSEIVDASGAVVGVISSGTFSPTLERPIAMGYVRQAAVGTPLSAALRGRLIALTPTSLPFVATRYKKG